MDDHILTKREQLTAIIGGCALLLVGIVFFFIPPSWETVTFQEGAEIERVLAPGEPYGISLALVLCGAGLVLFGTNKLRLAKFSAGPASAEAQGPKEKARDYYEDAASHKEPVELKGEVAAEEVDSPDSSEPPDGVFETQSGEKYAAYRLSAIPVKLLKDLFSNWPAETPLPADLSTFEFATKKQGRGNHPWTIKFKGSPAFKVSYGGQGKEEGTVSTQDPNQTA